MADNDLSFREAAKKLPILGVFRDRSVSFPAAPMSSSPCLDLGARVNAGARPPLTLFLLVPSC